MARTKSEVGGPAWQASLSHGPRLYAVGSNQTPSFVVKYESNMERTLPVARRIRQGCLVQLET